MEKVRGERERIGAGGRKEERERRVERKLLRFGRATTPISQTPCGAAEEP